MAFRARNGDTDGLAASGEGELLNVSAFRPLKPSLGLDRKLRTGDLGLGSSGFNVVVGSLLESPSAASSFCILKAPIEGATISEVSKDRVASLLVSFCSGWISSK